MKNSKGFSLIEAVVAMMLTILVVIFVFSIFPSTRIALAQAENHVNAATIGRSLLSDARRAGIDNVVATSGSRTISGIDNGQPYTQVFNYTLNVRAVNANKKYVWATVTWKEAGGKQRQVVVETILVKPQ